MAHASTPFDTGAGQSGGTKGFLSTTGGKMVAVGVTLGALVVLASVAGIAFLLLSGGSLGDVIPGSPAAAGPALSVVATSTPDGSAGGSGETTKVPPPVPNSELFTFRDIFKPIVVKPAQAAPPKSGGSEGGGQVNAAEGEPDTLYLQDISVENGVEKAVLTYNGQQYVLAEGGVIAGTPWKLLAVDGKSRSAVMLYGDSQVTLTVGQGTTAGGLSK
ncbi:MAG: hypothetical protein IBX62_02815 [Coriobacteriia bacterium]|nr:hypothetical protein [Coriobacteriia bacterium]